MSAHDFFLIVHLQLFCYWLGGDMGVFYSSGMVINPKIPREGRRIAAKIMINLDLVPRICMSLMLTVGGILSEFKGLEHPAWQMAAIVLLGPFWLSMVLLIHFREGTPLAKTVTRVDFWFRWLVIASVVASVGYSFSTGRLAPAPWIGYKLLLFAAMVFCGLMIRVYIGGYAAGIHALAKGEPTDAQNVAMAESLGRCRPFVYGIWIGLVLEAALGVIEPGSPEGVAQLRAVGDWLYAATGPVLQAIGLAG